ncbi:uncharacterized protein LOC123474555 [Daphnia magna]|uniref:uncharacterized protein LOC123474555 n=1 Tax=Daphnia magna TaxID=35525 RepID=UPI001E1BC7C7|nr:uncharacterized protein LOC123474555 [Daphnia magna]
MHCLTEIDNRMAAHEEACLTTLRELESSIEHLANKNIKQYSADVNRLKQEKLYKNHEQDLRCIYVKLVRFTERCKSNNSVTVNTPFQEAINNLEGLFLEIQVLKRKVSKDAERSKQRKRLQKRIRTVKDKARKLMSKIKEQYKLDISEEQFDSVPYHEDQQLCEAWMLTCRCEEEVIISPNELKQFFATLNQLLLDLQDKLKNQTGRIIEITSKIEEGCAASSLLDEKEILSGSNFLIESEIYNLSCIESTGLDLLRNDLLKAKEGMDDEELLEHLILSEDFSGTIPNADKDLDEEDADEDEDDDYDYEDFETDESGSEDVGINSKSNAPNEDHRAEELFLGNLDDEDCGI